MAKLKNQARAVALLHVQFQNGNSDKVSLMMAYQCDNEALDEIRQYGNVDTTHAASDGCKEQARHSRMTSKKLLS